MVLKKDQERIKLLLKDTITLLCKNGLTFKNEFSIEATIGITLDQDEVLLVSIHEIIQSELRAAKNAALQLEAENGQFAGNSEDQSGSTSPASTGKHHRKRRRSKVTVQEAEYDGHDSYDEDGSLDSESQHPPVKKSGRIDIKNESDDANNAEDLVFVKQEVEAGDWPTITSQGQGRLNEHEADQDSYTTYSSSMQQENLDFLQGASLEPVSAHVGHTALNRSQKTLAPSAVDMTPGPSNSQMVDPSRPLQLVTGRSAQSLSTPVHDEAKPLMLTSKAPTMPSPRIVASSFGQALVQSAPLQTSMAPNFVMLSPAMLSAGLSQHLALMSPPLGLPIAHNLTMIPPAAAKALLTTATVTEPPVNLTKPMNLSRSVANLTVTSPSIRGPRLANDRPLLSSPTDCFKTFGKIGKVRRSSSSSSTSTMDPPLMSPAVKSVRSNKPTRRSSVDVMVLKLNDTQEKEIVTFVNNMATLGYKVSIKEVCKMAHEMVFPKRQYKKMDVGHIKTFGPDWWMAFLARHPEIEEKDGHVLPCAAPKSV